MEFELSRLLEKEIHFHVKVEQEKRELEAMPDFNTVAVFSVVDPLQYGYLDAENLRTFMQKFSCQDTDPLSKHEIYALIRRMSEHPDGKITFREFSLAITPQMAGLPESAAKVEFNREQKDAHMRQMAESPGRTPKSIRGPFRDIQKSPAKSPYKQEFQELALKQTENPDTQYVLDMARMGSPSKDRDALKHSHRVLKSVSENPVLHNHLKGQN